MSVAAVITQQLLFLSKTCLGSAGCVLSPRCPLKINLSISTQTYVICHLYTFLVVQSPSAFGALNLHYRYISSPPNAVTLENSYIHTHSHVHTHSQQPGHPYICIILFSFQPLARFLALLRAVSISTQVSMRTVQGSGHLLIHMSIGSVCRTPTMVLGARGHQNLRLLLI